MQDMAEDVKSIAKILKCAPEKRCGMRVWHIGLLGSYPVGGIELDVVKCELSYVQKKSVFYQSVSCMFGILGLIT